MACRDSKCRSWASDAWGCRSSTARATTRSPSRTLERAVEHGINFFDTADVYGVGHNEELVGKALKKYRDRVFIATKFGNQVMPGGKRAINGRPEYVRSACDASLKRLGVDHIDLYYQHRVDKNVPIEETVGAMAELARQGKVRYLGLSEAGAKTIRRAHAIHPISALQSEYSIWTRDYEDEVIPTLRELGIGFVPFSPLGRGFLSGKLRDLPADDMRRKVSPRFDDDNMQRNQKVVDRLTEIAREKGITPSQLALAWVLAKGKDMVPIPGTKRRTYLEENVAAAKIQLSKSDLARIEEVAPKGFAAGGRYHDMSTVNV